MVRRIGIVSLCLLSLGAACLWSETPSRTSPRGSAEISSDGELEKAPPKVLLSQEGGELRIWSNDLKSPQLRSAASCNGGLEASRAAGEWKLSPEERSALTLAPSTPLSAPVVNPVTGAYDACDCTLLGYTATAQTCAPDCHSDCDEGHDGTSCHVHQYYRIASQSYLTYIRDFVDCCECTSDTTNDCGNTIDTNNCGLCAGTACSFLGPGFPSCCSYSSGFVRHRKLSSSTVVGNLNVHLERGGFGRISNETFVTQGGREDCKAGSLDGWRTSAFPPDKDISSFTVGSFIAYNWPCTDGAPTFTGGGGFSCSCYQDAAVTCSDGVCSPFDTNDPDCAACSLVDGVCTPGCEDLGGDPDCLPSSCPDPTQINCM